MKLDVAGAPKEGVEDEEAGAEKVEVVEPKENEGAAPFDAGCAALEPKAKGLGAPGVEDEALKAAKGLGEATPPKGEGFCRRRAVSAAQQTRIARATHRHVSCGCSGGRGTGSTSASSLGQPSDPDEAARVSGRTR